MKIEYLVLLISLSIFLLILVAVLAYLQEKKKDAQRKERALLKGWNYESAKSSQLGFKVEGQNGSLIWQLEARKKGSYRSLIFSSKSNYLNNGVFYFADKREIDLILKPYMQFALKLGTNLSNNQSEDKRLKAISLLQNAKILDIHPGIGRWNYSALATSTDFGYKIFSMGFQGEIDSLSLIDSSKIPPAVILSPDGLEIQWHSTTVDADKMEMIIDASLRLMTILNNAVKNS